MNTTTKKNKLPLRRCIVTGEQLSKRELLRIVKTPIGEIVIDPTGKMNGRGAYIKKDQSLLPSLIKQRHLEKTFAQEIPISFYERLKSYLHE